MPARGQFKRPTLRRYAGVPACEAVYLMEFGDRCVKVGRSRCAYARLRGVHMEIERLGYTPGRFMVIKCTTLRSYDAELAAIDALSRVGVALPRRREYFTGISYDDAVRIVIESAKA